MSFHKDNLLLENKTFTNPNLLQHKLKLNLGMLFLVAKPHLCRHRGIGSRQHLLPRPLQIQSSLVAKPYLRRHRGFGSRRTAIYSYIIRYPQLRNLTSVGTGGLVADDNEPYIQRLFIYIFFFFFIIFSFFWLFIHMHFGNIIFGCTNFV